MDTYEYEIVEEIDEGSFGVVFKAQHKESKEMVALKKIENEESGISPTGLREIANLRLLSSSSQVVDLMEVKYSENSITLVLELLEMDLKKLINNKPLPHDQIKTFMHQLCKGVADCHSFLVLHRDLKPKNLLVNKKEGILKICDFGIGRFFTEPEIQYTNKIGTFPYVAPEVLLQSETYFTGVDMWAVGCIFAEMANGSKLFPGNVESEQELLELIFSLLGAPTEEVWPGVTKLKGWKKDYSRYTGQDIGLLVPLGNDGLDLLKKMLTYDPDQRISAKAALEHRYFEGLDPQF